MFLNIVRAIGSLILVAGLFFSVTFHSAWFVLGWAINVFALVAVLYDKNFCNSVGGVCFYVGLFGTTPLALLYMVRPWVNEVYAFSNAFATSLLIAWFAVFMLIILISAVVCNSKKESDVKAQDDCG